jgi:hypothetical protein
MYMLHKRYTSIGQLQLSCDSEKPRAHRWCESCYECARIYLFLHAIGVDPTTVGFVGDMFQRSKRKLYYIFPDNANKTNGAYMYKRYAERLFAFYLACMHGVKGQLIDDFRCNLFPFVHRHRGALIKRFCSLGPMRTIPEDVKRKILPIYLEELNKMKRDIR